MWGLAEARPLAPLGGATMRLFSKKARLKSGKQRLALTLGRDADFAWDSVTPGKTPLAERSDLGCVSFKLSLTVGLGMHQAVCTAELGRTCMQHAALSPAALKSISDSFCSCRRLGQLVKRYERGELRRVEWLDGLTMRAVDRLRDEVIGV